MAKARSNGELSKCRSRVESPRTTIVAFNRTTIPFNLKFLEFLLQLIPVFFCLFVIFIIDVNSLSLLLIRCVVVSSCCHVVVLLYCHGGGGFFVSGALKKKQRLLANVTKDFFFCTNLIVAQFTQFVTGRFDLIVRACFTQLLFAFTIKPVG